MKIITLFFALTLGIQSRAQQNTFRSEELIAVVKKYHPVARQAGIDIRIARSEITASRAAFDPLLRVENNRKEFDGTIYYDQRIHEIKIPTWYGIDLYAGSEKITGSRINPEETAGTLNYLGFSVPVVQNLLIDKRRAALLQAKNFLLQSELQRRIVINDLMLDALKNYWDWWEKHHVYQLVQSALQNAQKRSQLVKSAYLLGDRPAIDTLEAHVQVQSFQIQLSAAYEALIKAQLQLSAFLWTENQKPVDLTADVIPQDFSPVQTILLEEMLHVANIHPEILQYDYTLKGIQIEKKLAFQSLLPEINLKYNQTGYQFSNTVQTAWFNNNYRYGIFFSLPLRLSEGRGEYNKARLKIESTRMEQANKQVLLFTRVKQYYTEWQQTETQLILQNQLVTNIGSLQRGEEIRFLNGESSLFLINTRELKTIEAQQKAIELKSKTQKAAIGVRWSAGLLAQ